MTDPLPDETARAIRRVLNDVLRKTGAVNREVALIFDLLDGSPPPAVAPPANDGAAPAGDPVDAVAYGSGKRYEVRDVDGEPRLLESRDDGGAPFAVPQRVYAAFAAATTAGSGRKYDQIYRKVMHELGDAARDYHGRVLFRFWQARGLLSRDRGRYAVVGPRDTFPARAQNAWDALATAAAARD